MEKVEQAALNAVSDLIAPCLRLIGRFTANDKTPMTDGCIDVYANGDHKNATLNARVPVQIKGRSVRRDSKKQKDSVSFAVGRDELRFLRNSGGGIYFYVSINALTFERTVYYAVLTPFKSERYLAKMSQSQLRISVQLKKMPTDSASVERIVGLAVQGQNQRVSTGFDEAILRTPHRLVIHSVDGLDLSRPTSLTLDTEDFAVTMQTAGGFSIPVDVDVDMYPASYVPHEVDVLVRCGDVSYASATVRLVDETSVEVQLSKAVRLLLRQEAEVSSELNFELDGSVDEQIRDIDFVLAMSAGNPLVVNDASYTLQSVSAAARSELTEVRQNLEQISELFHALEVDATLIELTRISREHLSTLLALYRGIVLNEEIAGEIDGLGRIDVDAGRFKVTALVTPGSSQGRIRIIDPFKPANRDKFLLYRKLDTGEMEEMADATVYDGLPTSDLRTILNLHLDEVVRAYRSVANGDLAKARANQLVLELLKAADNSEGPHREALLRGAESLNEWLLTFGDESPVHLINMWQILRRQGKFEREHRAAVRSARKRALCGSDANANVQEVCYSILLGDDEQVEAGLGDLSEGELSDLHGWPIWALYLPNQANIATRG